jgi:CIC family chloride channel protein
VTPKRLVGLQELRLRENQLFLALSIIIGILAGLAAVLFSLAIERMDYSLFGFAPSSARLFFIPVVVSVGTGILLAKVFPGVRGSGVPQTKAAFHLHGGVIPWHVPLGKFITAVLCIGSGHSMGREGPSVQIGAGIASAIGQWLRLSPGRVKELVPVGAAGALAAAFNTPVAAVLFALEEIIGDMNATLLGSTVVASVASVVVQRSILGDEPLFRVPAYELVHPAELAGYALLGVAGGIVSLAFCKGLLAARRLFLRMPRWTRILQPAMGGLVIGAFLVFFPEIKGVGYEYVDQALNGGLLFQTMLALCLLKLVATIVSYSSGNAGGIFAPSLYIGAMAGGAVGMVVNEYAPFPTGAPGAYALVGMGTLFAGIIRAPMTSVFMIFEITQDYHIFVPLMVANLLSFVISRRYQPVAVYQALLQQDDIHLPSPALRSSNAVVTAGEMMAPPPGLLAGGETVEAGWGHARTDARSAFLVGADGRLLGIVTRERLAAAHESGRGGDPLHSIVDPAFVHVHADHGFDVVLERFADSAGLLPVVSRKEARRLEGVITLDEITRFIRRRRAGSPADQASAQA